MMTIIIILLAMFLFISIVPFSQWVYYSKGAKNQVVINYVFEQQLFETDLDELKIEDVSKQSMTLEQMKNRGSVRIAQGLAFDATDFEQRKQEEYAIELP